MRVEDRELGAPAANPTHESTWGRGLLLLVTSQRRPSGAIGPARSRCVHCALKLFSRITKRSSPPAPFAKALGGVTTMRKV
jgi:hypothetical protein